MGGNHGPSTKSKLWQHNNPRQCPLSRVQTEHSAPLDLQYQHRHQRFLGPLCPQLSYPPPLRRLRPGLMAQPTTTTLIQLPRSHRTHIRGPSLPYLPWHLQSTCIRTRAACQDRTHYNHLFSVASAKLVTSVLHRPLRTLIRRLSITRNLPICTKRVSAPLQWRKTLSKRYCS
jgi:hypothetical protein